MRVQQTGGEKCEDGRHCANIANTFSSRINVVRAQISALSPYSARVALCVKKSVLKLIRNNPLHSSWVISSSLTDQTFQFINSIQLILMKHKTQHQFDFVFQLRHPTWNNSQEKWLWTFNRIVCQFQSLERSWKLIQTFSNFFCLIYWTICLKTNQLFQ